MRGMIRGLVVFTCVSVALTLATRLALAQSAARGGTGPMLNRNVGLARATDDAIFVSAGAAAHAGADATPAQQLESAAGGLASPKLTPELVRQLRQSAASDQISCIVLMKDELPYATVSTRSTQDRIDTFRAVAQSSQAPVLAALGQWGSTSVVPESFWVVNGFHLVATPDVIRWLSARDDIREISFDDRVFLIEPSAGGEQSGTERGIEWNVTKVGAPACWSMGFDGQGVVIAQTDTGVDATHPALQDRFSGYWHDSINGNTSPYDDNGHGTHTMGTIVGAGGIGVAPGATFVAAKVLDSGGSGNSSQILNGMQWIADLKATVDIKAMSASWGGGSSTWAWNTCQTYKSIGILPVFANGNAGPAPGSAGSPGNYPLVLGVGATNSSDNIASFSSRGPAPNEPPWNDPTYWYRPDWNLVKPDLAAPGVNVRSSWPGGQYQFLSGTSMATPHVTGAVAILSQENPNLDPTTLYEVLLDTSDHPAQGAPYPNESYGWGRLNVYHALLQLCDVQFTQQPQSVNGCIAGTVQLSVAVNISAPAYQWRIGTDNLNDDGVHIFGATTSTLTIVGLTPADVSDQYNCQATNATDGCIGVSNDATVGVLTPVSITQQPADKTIDEYSNVSLHVGVTGDAPLSYQWRHNGVNLATGGNVYGATTPTLVVIYVEAKQAGYYDVVVTNSCGPVTSSAAHLVVNTGFGAGRGDLNCDGSVDFGDINPFVLALSSGETTYYNAYPDCHYYNADINTDGDVGFGDINPFVSVLSGSP
jgi:subtilisin family serine protease